MPNHETYPLAEKQLISTLAWFRSRYALFMGLALDRAANQANIEAFGAAWLGTFKADWTRAFSSLCEKNILRLEGETYEFTPEGQALQAELEAQTPFFKYEYDNFFQLAQSSSAHALFCEKVYGLNLCQHGLINQSELSLLLTRLKTLGYQTMLDLGCGNGLLTEWLAEQASISSLGLDISSEAIQQAQTRCAAKPLLRFELGNLNRLDLPKQYEAILFLDSLYYADNLKNSLEQAWRVLAEGGRIFAYFSQWIMDSAYRDNLLGHNTHLAKVLQTLGLNYNFTDLSASAYRHWQDKLAVLEELKPLFQQEGQQALWDYRYREAARYAHWGEDKYARYFYEISKP